MVPIIQVPAQQQELSNSGGGAFQLGFILRWTLGFALAEQTVSSGLLDAEGVEQP